MDIKLVLAVTLALLLVLTASNLLLAILLWWQRLPVHPQRDEGVRRDVPQQAVSSPLSSQTRMASPTERRKPISHDDEALWRREQKEKEQGTLS